MASCLDIVYWIANTACTSIRSTGLCLSCHLCWSHRRVSTWGSMALSSYLPGSSWNDGII